MCHICRQQDHQIQKLDIFPVLPLPNLYNMSIRLRKTCQTLDKSQCVSQTVLDVDFA